MAIIIGTNSWVTIAEADTYLTQKINVEDWFTLSDDGVSGGTTKENLLVTAYRWLLDAPGVSLSATTSDDNVKNAQIESAIWLQAYEQEIKDRSSAIYSGVSSFKLSKRSENLDIKNVQIPAFILGMIRSYSEQNTTVDFLGEYDV